MISNLLFNSIERLFDLHLFLKTFPILLVNLSIFLFLQLNIWLIFFNLSFQLFQMFSFNLLGLYKLFEPQVMLNLTIEFFTLFLELFLSDLRLLLKIFQILFSLVPGTVGLSCRLDSLLNILFFSLQLFLQFCINIFHSIFFFT